MKEYRQAQHSVQESLLSNVAKVQPGQIHLAVKRKLSTHCYLTKTFESWVTKYKQEPPLPFKYVLFLVHAQYVLNTLFSGLCTQDISHINVFTFPLETSYLLLSKQS